jgi:WD40 repeat protein
MLFLIFLAFGLSAQAEKPVRPSGTDFYGDPLPPGAVARMGTNRFGDTIDGGDLLLSPDGTTIVLQPMWNNPLVQVCDAVTGQVLYSFNDQKTAPKRPLTIFGFSPDSRLLALRSGDQIEFREQRTGRVVRSLTEKIAKIAGGLFANDSKTFAVWCENGDCWRWDTATGHLQRTLRSSAKKPEAMVALSADLKTLAKCVDGHEITLWNLDSGSLTRTLPRQVRELYQLTFSPSGDTLFAFGGGQSNIHCFTATDGNEIRIDNAHPYRVHRTAISPDGRTIAAIRSGPDHEQEVDLWKLPRGEHFAALRGGRSGPGWHWGVNSLAFTHDGRKIAIGGDRRVLLYDVESRRLVREWFLSSEEVEAEMRFSADDKVLAVRAESAVVFLDVIAGGWLRRPPRHTTDVNHLAFSTDGRTLVSGGGDGTIRVWNSITGEQLERLQDDGEWTEHLAISGNGRNLVSISHAPTDRVSVWRLPGQRPITTFVHESVHTIIGMGYEREAFALSEDGKSLVLTRDARKTIEFFEAATGKLTAELDYRPGLESMDLSPDGRVLAVLTEKAIDLLDVKSRAVAHRIARPGAKGQLTYSWDGRYLMSVAEGRVQLWELATLREALRYEPKPDTFARAAGYAADGRVLVLQNDSDHRYSIVGTWSATPAITLPDYPLTRGSRFSPRAQRLAVGTHSGEILVWDLRTLLRNQEPLAPAPSEMNRLWAELAVDDAERAYQAGRKLIASPMATVEYVRAHLAPGPPNNAPALIAALDDQSFKVRQQAQRELEALGASAELAITAALSGKLSLEMRARLDAHLARIRSERPPPEKLRAIRSVAVLEYIGTDDARRLIRALARGRGDSWIASEAGKAAKRMTSRAGAID